MNNNQLIQKVFDLQKSNTLNYQIDKLLNSSNLTEEEIIHIKEEANKLYAQYKREFIIKRNRIVFFSAAAVTVVTLLVFFILLPKQNIVTNVGILSIFGTLLLCLGMYCMFVFYNSWKPENIDVNPSLDFDLGNFFSFFGLLAAIPAVIFYFLISWLIESGAEKRLLETKVETKAIVVNGNYYEGGGIRRRRPDEAEITVKFRTKENKVISRTIEIPSYQFNHFYKGQQIDIIYSSENTNNIKLLNSKESIKQVYKTEERDVFFKDLFTFLELSDKQIQEKLSTMSVGWSYNVELECWVNPSRECYIKRAGKSIFYIPKRDFIMFMDNDIRKNSFKRTLENQDSLLARYENEKYLIEKLSTRQGNTVTVFYSVSKNENSSSEAK
ncbi:hypothetical protein M0M57_15395 [Flavobacterium azooxidireducens]|uniref:DUF3592 domain-containing protein n=1 Tax=Flavobacterium azooxidireducens TaxID=1871076 RepID=A0ABY4KDX2_9FLAO|nr:hypothetical protein [Flavobacterium azooxidireducens]UPQ78991.1 hypothetical protein M0M57_15395 [Flavobacterium azooxidireducens]